MYDCMLPVELWEYIASYGAIAALVRVVRDLRPSYAAALRIQRNWRQRPRYKPVQNAILTVRRRRGGNAMHVCVALPQPWSACDTVALRCFRNGIASRHIIFMHQSGRDDEYVIVRRALVRNGQSLHVQPGSRLVDSPIRRRTGFLRKFGRS